MLLMFLLWVNMQQVCGQLTSRSITLFATKETVSLITSCLDVGGVRHFSEYLTDLILIESFPDYFPALI